jgi:chromosome segregation ATPase
VLEIPERVKVIEKRMEDYTTLFADIRTGLQRFEARVDARFTSVDTRFTSIDTRFTQIDARFTQIDRRFTQIDARFTQIDTRFTQIDARFTALEQKVDRGFAQSDERLEVFRREMSAHFRWAMGIMITCLAAVVAGMGAIFAAVVSQ